MFGFGGDLLDEVARGSLTRGLRGKRVVVRGDCRVDWKENGDATDSSALARLLHPAPG
jgi:hypothetical protein